MISVGAVLAGVLSSCAVNGTAAAVASLSRCAPSAQRLSLPSGAAVRPLVPPDVRTLLLCRYRGLNPPATAGRLIASRLVGGRSEVDSIGRALNALPPLPKAVSCPLDDGREIVASFTDAAGATTVVRIGLSGCRVVSGAHPPARTASSPAGQALIARLVGLL